MRIPKLSDVFARRTDPFRLSVSEARSKYKDLQNEMIKGLGLDVEWKYKDLTGTGSGGNTRDNMDGTALVKLDCPILARLEAGEDVGRIAIPGKDVVRQTIAQCHEIRHLWQFVDAR